MRKLERADELEKCSRSQNGSGGCGWSRTLSNDDDAKSGVVSPGVCGDHPFKHRLDSRWG